MLNWNVGKERFKREDPEGYKRWRIEQLINYGLDDGEKLDKNEVKKAWPEIKENVDPYIARLVEYLCMGKTILAPRYAVISELISARIRNKMTQKDVADKVGTKQSAIARLESGNVNPSLEFLRKIATVMGYKLTVHLAK